MSTKRKDKIRFILGLALITLPLIMGCSNQQSASSSLSSVSPHPSDPHSGSGNNGNGNQSSTPNPIVVGSGSAVAGTGALTGPTADAVVGRLANGLEGSVNPTAGNFARSLASLRNNLPKSTDPTKATGFDQVQLLVYAACSDLTTGATPIMRSRYNVIPTNTIATNQNALVAAGVRMLNQHVAGLASDPLVAGEVTAAFTELVTKNAAVANTTSTMAFMSVCIAANTAGSSMMSF